MKTCISDRAVQLAAHHRSFPGDQVGRHVEGKLLAVTDADQHAALGERGDACLPSRAFAAGIHMTVGKLGSGIAFSPLCWTSDLCRIWHWAPHAAPNACRNYALSDIELRLQGCPDHSAAGTCLRNRFTLPRPALLLHRGLYPANARLILATAATMSSISRRDPSSMDWYSQTLRSLSDSMLGQG